MICEDKGTNDHWKKKNIIMILFASAFNSCMIEVSIPDFNEIIISNIISLFLSFSNTERREVVFRTQCFIGHYCSEREGRGYRCRGTSVPLSLYFISILWRLVMTAFNRRPVKVYGFLLFQTITGAKVRFFFSIFTTQPSTSSLFQCPTGHESRHFPCQYRVYNIHSHLSYTTQICGA